MELLSKPLNSEKGIQRRVRPSVWAAGGGGSQAEAQKRIRGVRREKAEEQPAGGLRGQSAEPLCLELVKFAERTMSPGRG